MSAVHVPVGPPASGFAETWEGQQVEIDPRPASNGIVFIPLPDDEHRRKRMAIERDAVRLGTMLYLGWKRHLVIYGVELVEGTPGAVEAETVTALLEQFDELPEFFTHSAILHPETLHWYADSAYANGTVYCGTIRGHHMYYDTYPHLSQAILNGEPSEWDDVTQFVAMCARDADYRVVSLGGSAEELGRRLVSGTWLSRIVLIRAMSLTTELPNDLIDLAHCYALMDDNYAVRQFASMQMSGFFPGQLYRPSLELQLSHLVDPLQTIALFGERPPVAEGVAWDPMQGRRNLRFALLYSIGNLVWNAGSMAHPWMEDMPARVLAVLESQLPLSAERDQALYELAVCELGSTQPHEAFGVGADEPFNLLELLRYTVHRHRVVRRQGVAKEDRFYWLPLTLDAVAPSPMSPTHYGGEDDRPIAIALYGPSPRTPEVLQAPIPPWLKGVNPYVEFMGEHEDP